jgi:hypothetical protein
MAESPVYIVQKGLLHWKENLPIVSGGARNRPVRIPIETTTSIWIFSEQVEVTTTAIWGIALKHQKPIHMVSRTGDYVGTFWNFIRNADVVVEQVKSFNDEVYSRQFLMVLSDYLERTFYPFLAISRYDNVVWKHFLSLLRGTVLELLIRIGLDPRYGPQVEGMVIPLYLVVSGFYSPGLLMAFYDFRDKIGYAPADFFGESDLRVRASLLKQIILYWERLMNKQILYDGRRKFLRGGLYMDLVKMRTAVYSKTLPTVPGVAVRDVWLVAQEEGLPGMI